MTYRQCSACGAITDKNESKCPCCKNNNLSGKVITAEELASMLKNGKILRSKIWTKRPIEIDQVLKSLPS